MKLRHEWKHEINTADLLILRMRLPVILKKDPHLGPGETAYEVRSLYFDTPSDRALREKLDGVDRREKFRLRLYNGDTSYIQLEKKSKYGNLSEKLSCPVKAEEVRRLLAGDIGFLRDSERPLCRELYVKMQSGLLRPKQVVSYTREPFVFGPGNVRVTIDENIRTGLRYQDFLKPDPAVLPLPENPVILEVKWDGFLPDIVKEAAGLSDRHAAAFSKYAQSRIYG